MNELMGACWRYVKAGSRKKSVLFEYVMLDGVNDNPAEARALAKLLRNFPGKVNLIPFNPFPGNDFEGPGLIASAPAARYTSPVCIRS